MTIIKDGPTFCIGLEIEIWILGTEVMGSERGPRFWSNVGSWLGFRLGGPKSKRKF